MKKQLSFQIVTVIGICLGVLTVGRGQIITQTYLTKQKEAAESLKNRQYDLAIILYAEAIDLFPKSDDFTPNAKKPDPSEGNLASGEYRGLDKLYLGRFWAHLGKNSDELAQADLNRSLLVLKSEVRRALERATTLRSSVRMEDEKRIENVNSHNSELIKAGFLFNGIGWSCGRIRSTYTFSLKHDFGPTIPERFLIHESSVKVLNEIYASCQDARFSEAEVAMTAMIDLRNRAYNFRALELANKLVIDFPRNAESYRLRSTVNRYLGNEQQAVLDELKVKELSEGN